MTSLPGGWRRLVTFWRRGAAQDVDIELAFHLEERRAELMAQGQTAAAAEAQALREFGDVATVRKHLVQIDQRRDQRHARAERWEWLLQDLGYVIQSLRRSPGFVAMVVLTLALGLGVNTAIFSVLDRLFLRTPPGVVAADGLRRLYRLDPPRASAALHDLRGTAVPAVSTRINFSWPEMREVVAALPAGTPIAGYHYEHLKLDRGESAREVGVTLVAGDYFHLLGVRPAVGRFFAADEVQIERPRAVAVIGRRLWQGRFGGRPDIIGQTVDVGYHRFEVIGVAGDDFHGVDNDASDIWLPMSAMQDVTGHAQEDGHEWYEDTGTMYIRLLVRGDARAWGAIEASATRTFRASTFVPDSSATARIVPLAAPDRTGVGAQNVAITTRLAGVALIILLVACANVANLLLARGMRRRRELAVRLALGVSRARLTTMLVMESVVVSLLGAVVALGVAYWGANALCRLLIPDVHWVDPLIDARIVGFTMALAVVTGVVAALVPAWRSSNPDLAGMLKAGTRDGTFQRSALRGGLLVAQAAFAVVLLAGAGLFIRSLRSVETTDIGYDSDRVVFGRVTADPEHRDRAREIRSRLPALADQLGRVGGVQGVALVANTPMRTLSFTEVALPGRDSLPRVGVEGPFVSYVSPTFFDVVGMRLLSGRGITAQDRAEDGIVVVVNATMARAYWPDRSPIGECLMLVERQRQCATVVGVVTDGHFNGIIEKPGMQFYLPLAAPGQPHSAGVIVLRTAAGASTTVANQTRALLRTEFGGWAEPEVTTMRENLAAELRPWQTGAVLFSVAGLLALLVAIVGIYSTISYVFGQRSHEIGVRMALGARAGSVARLIVGEGLRIVLVGIAAGVALALAGSRLVESMLYQVSPRDPVVLAAVSLALVLAAVVACLVPAWRALRVDPAMALRME